MSTSPRLYPSIPPPPSRAAGSKTHRGVANVQEIIHRAARRENVDPTLLTAQAKQESGFKQNAVSHKGARGVMQIMPGTARTLARELGTTPQKVLRDPETNISAGARLMNKLLTKYQNAPNPKQLALAAYNAGEGAVDKYKGVPPYRETKSYVQVIDRENRRLRERAAATGNAPGDQDRSANAATNANPRLEDPPKKPVSPPVIPSIVEPAPAVDSPADLPVRRSRIDELLRTIPNPDQVRSSKDSSAAELPAGPSQAAEILRSIPRPLSVLDRGKPLASVESTELPIIEDSAGHVSMIEGKRRVLGRLAQSQSSEQPVSDEDDVAATEAKQTRISPPSPSAPQRFPGMTEPRRVTVQIGDLAGRGELSRETLSDRVLESIGFTPPERERLKQELAAEGRGLPYAITGGDDALNQLKGQMSATTGEAPVYIEPESYRLYRQKLGEYRKSAIPEPEQIKVEQQGPDQAPGLAPRPTDTIQQLIEGRIIDSLQTGMAAGSEMAGNVAAGVGDVAASLLRAPQAVRGIEEGLARFGGEKFARPFLEGIGHAIEGYQGKKSDLSDGFINAGRGAADKLEQLVGTLFEASPGGVLAEPADEAGKVLQTGISELVPDRSNEPFLDRVLLQSGPRALGSVAAFALGGEAAAAAKAPAWLASAGLGSLTEAEQLYNQAIAEGRTKEAAAIAGLFGAAIGATEALGGSRNIEEALAVNARTIRQFAKEKSFDALEEVVQETGQTAGEQLQGGFFDTSKGLDSAALGETAAATLLSQAFLGGAGGIRSKFSQKQAERFIENIENRLAAGEQVSPDEYGNYLDTVESLVQAERQKHTPLRERKEQVLDGEPNVERARARTAPAATETQLETEGEGIDASLQPVETRKSEPEHQEIAAEAGRKEITAAQVRDDSGIRSDEGQVHQREAERSGGDVESRQDLEQPASGERGATTLRRSEAGEQRQTTQAADATSKQSGEEPPLSSLWKGLPGEEAPLFSPEVLGELTTEFHTGEALPQSTTRTKNRDRSDAQVVSSEKPEGRTERSKTTDLAGTATALDSAAHDAATSLTNSRPEPTEGQIKAGNYAKGHVRISGLDLSIENPEGSVRSGKDANGKPWSLTMQSHYGYIRGYEGKDKEHIDVFVRPGTDADYDGSVFVVNQKNARGSFDEHKVMLGFSDEASAREGYLANYEQGWDGIESIARFDSPAEFRQWLATGNLKKPAPVQVQRPEAQAIKPTIENEDVSESDPGAKSQSGIKPGDIVTHPRFAGGQPLRVESIDGDTITLSRVDGSGKALTVKSDSPIGRELQVQPQQATFAQSAAEAVAPDQKEAQNAANEYTASPLETAAAEPVGTVSARPLAGSPAEPVSRTDRKRRADTGTRRSSESSEGDVQQPDRSGDESVLSQRDRAGRADIPGSRGGRGGQAGEAGDGADARRGESGDRVRRLVDDTRTDSQKPSAAHTAGNFRLEDPSVLTSGGKKTKFKQNVQALQTLRTIQAEGRTATREEQETLSRFSGWGQFPEVFNYHYKGSEWFEEQQQLKRLLSDDEFEAARKSTLNAHYTAPEIVQAVWQATERLGFRSGRVLEPSMGIGNFFALMPAEAAEQSLLTGIELDRATGAMAQLLYPDANIQVRGFETLKVPNNFFDLAIGNVPFGDFRVFDKEYDKYGANIHDYFFLKSVDKVRPGGLVVFITSTGTMDKANSKIRRLLSEKADLISAIRFPSETFQKSAGTSVVTDLIILRKRDEGESASGPSWIDIGSTPDPDGGDPIRVNQYFVEHPEQVLGRLDRKGTMYRAQTVNVSRTDDFDERLRRAIEVLPESVMTEASIEQPASVLATPRDQEMGVKDGGRVVRKGQVLRRQGDTFVEEQMEPEKVKRLQALLGVRDAVKATVNAQLEGKTENEIKQARQNLNRVYDQFVAGYGPINKRSNKSVIQDEPDGPILLALEDQSGKNWLKADIFRKNTVRSFQVPDKAETPGEAVGISLFEKGRLDIARISELLGTDKADAEAQLSESSLAFHDPEAGWVPRDTYLSGNVRRKLIQAREAAAADPRFQANIDALEKVQPEDIDYDEIEARLGVPWVPAEDVSQFMAELMQTTPDSFRVTFLPQQGTWVVEYTTRGAHLAHSNVATSVWGTDRAPFLHIIDAALNSRRIAIYDTVDDARVFSSEASEAANGKLNDIQEQFKDWIWRDDERRKRLHRYYNDNYNNIRPIEYDAAHYRNRDGVFVLPGQNPEIQLRPHQANAAWQIVSTGKALLAHEVGTGKTFTLVTGAMELRRLGLAKKPAIAVPKSIIAQFVREAKALYPNARILSTDGMFDQQSRRKTISKIATGDYDLIVMTHDNMDMLPMTPEVSQKYIQGELDELDEAIRASKEEDDRKNNRIVKQLEKAKAKLQTRLKEAIEGSRKDNAVFFEETGIDFLMVDEAHKYKSLPVYTSQRMKGIPTSRSDRATNMLMRSRWLQDQNKGRGVVLATGTPIANTLVELFNMQRYLQYQDLLDRDIAHFDSWLATFAAPVTKVEKTVTGEYAVVTRLASFVNLPELTAITRQFMDVRRADNMPEFIQRPKRADSAVVSPMTPSLQEYMGRLVKRADQVKNRRVEPNIDNMLKISMDGRKAALDMRLVDPNANDDPDSKLNALVENVLKYHRENPGKTQMIFSDLGTTPTEWGFNLYQDIIRKLVRGGIPKDKILDYSTLTDSKRRLASERLKNGEALVAIGSSEKLGTGVNAQHRLLALHHLDVPWLPAYIEQRDGRGWRQGNSNPTIFIHRYITEDSFDAFMWQLVENKHRFIQQVMSNKTTDRVVKELDTEELSYAELTAIASGNPLVLKKTQVEEDVERLERARRRHEAAQSRTRDTVRHLEETEIPALERRLESYRSDNSKAEATAHQDFRIEVKGKTYTDRKAVGESLLSRLLERNELPTGERDKVGSYRGFSLLVSRGKTLELAGEARYDVNVNEDSPAGTIASADSVLRNLGARIDRQVEMIQRKRDEQARLSEEIGKAFRNQAELESKKAELSQVLKTLRTTGKSKQTTSESDAEGVRGKFREKIGEEQRAEQRAGEAGFLSLGGGRKKRKRGQKESEYAFASEQEERWQAAKGVQGPPLGERVDDFLRKLKHRATREYEHLPRTAQHAELRQFLHQVEKGKGIVSDEALRLLHGITVKLDANGYDLFVRHVILSDLVEEIDRQQSGFTDELLLPFGFTAEEVASEHQRIRGLVEQDPNVKEAVADRKAVLTELTESYLKAANKVGFKPDLNREDYFRHQVLDYARTTAGVAGTGEKIKARIGRGFLKQRHGSALDINTDYLQVEYSVLSQMLYDTQVFRLLDLVKKNYDITSALKREARRANDDAIQKIIQQELMELAPVTAHAERPKSLAQFVREQGSIKPDTDLGGELQRLRESGMRGLVSRSGKLSPDLMREAAVEAGYLSEESDEGRDAAAFIEFLERRGNDAFTQADQDKLAGTALQEYLDEQLTDEERRARAYDELVGVVGPTEAQLMVYRRRIAIGFSRLRALAKNGELWAGESGEHQNAIDNLLSHRNYTEEMNDSRPLFRYLAALAANENAEGNLEARMILKAVSGRREFVKDRLGKQYRTFEDLIPETHRMWRADARALMFRAWTVPEQAMAIAFEESVGRLDIPLEQARQMTIFAGLRDGPVIPNEVAETLDHFANPQERNSVTSSLRAAVRAWKVWQLISPRRFFKYNFRNLSGDADAVIIGNPSTFKRVPRAAADLYNVLVRKGASSRELQSWLDRGGLYNLFQVAEELGDINGLKIFYNLAERKGGKLASINLWKQYWRAARMSTDFREALLRYAAYLDYLDQMKDSGRPKNFGASIREEVMALPEKEDRAWKLSNDLLGAYDEVTVLGQELRQSLFPFWSWQEVNAKRYKRLLMNAIKDGQLTTAVGNKLLGTAVRSPLIAARVGKFGLKAMAFTALLSAWNWMRFPDEEQELPDEVRYRPHIVLGRNPDGSVRYFNRLGAISDFLDWFGLDDAQKHVVDFLNGKKLSEIATRMAKSPVNKLVHATGPGKTMYEALAGRSIYPDVWKPRQIRDRMQYVFESLGLKDEYVLLEGKPTRGILKSTGNLFYYESDPDEASFDEIRALKSEFRLKKGHADAISESTRGNALYYYKQALRYGDRVAQRKYLAEYAAAGGTEKGLERSLMTLEPLYGLKDSELAEFVARLSDEEKKDLVRAYHYYQKVVVGLGEHGAEMKKARQSVKTVMLFFVRPHTLDRLVICAADASAFVVGDTVLQDTFQNGGEKAQRCEFDRTLGILGSCFLSRATLLDTTALRFVCCTTHDIV